MENNKLKPFWKKEGSDYIADLGIMKKAIVVRYYMGGYYRISEASYFPFEKKHYNFQSKNHLECCVMAENHITNWINSILINCGNKLIVEETKKTLN